MRPPDLHAGLARAQLIQFRGHVVAVEAHPGTAAMLRRSVEPLTAAGVATVVEAALVTGARADDVASVELSGDGEEYWGFRVNHTAAAPSAAALAGEHGTGPVPARAPTFDDSARDGAGALGAGDAGTFADGGAATASAATTTSKGASTNLTESAPDAVSAAARTSSDVLPSRGSSPTASGGARQLTEAAALDLAGFGGWAQSATGTQAVAAAALNAAAGASIAQDQSLAPAPSPAAHADEVSVVAASAPDGGAGALQLEASGALSAAGNPAAVLGEPAAALSHSSAPGSAPARTVLRGPEAGPAPKPLAAAVSLSSPPSPPPRIAHRVATTSLSRLAVRARMRHGMLGYRPGAAAGRWQRCISLRSGGSLACPLVAQGSDDVCGSVELRTRACRSSCQVAASM